MNEEQRKLAEKILDTLDNSRFADWYVDGDFDNFLNNEGCDGAPTRESILTDIVRLFRL